MKETEDSLLLIQSVMSHFIPLVDSRLSREGLLRKKGFKVYQVEKEIIKSFCKSDAIYKKELEFQLLEFKSLVSAGAYREKYVSKLYTQCDIEAREQRKRWLRSPSPFWRQFIKNQIDNPEEHKKIMHHFRLNEKPLWQQEVDNFSKYKCYKEKLTMYQCVNKILSENFHLIGFTINKSNSSKNISIFLKKITHDWSIYYQFDFSDLKNFGSPNKNMNSIGSFFGLIRHGEKKLNINKQIKSRLQLNFFFPMAICDLHQLKFFSSINELEAILNMHFVLYRILADEFENIAQKAVQ